MFFLFFFSTDILTLVTYIDRSALHCSSRSLLQTLQRVTPYCVITGIQISYKQYGASGPDLENSKNPN